MRPADGDLECRCGDRFALFSGVVRAGLIEEVRSEQRLIKGDTLAMWTAQGEGFHTGQLELEQRPTAEATVIVIYCQKYIFDVPGPGHGAAKALALSYNESDKGFFWYLHEAAFGKH